MDLEVGDIISLQALDESPSGKKSISDTHYSWMDSLYMIGWVSSGEGIIRYHTLDDSDHSWYTSKEYVVLVAKRDQYIRDSRLKQLGI